MSNPEFPEDKVDLAEARILWAASFLTDWLIPTVGSNHIDSPNEVIELREKFPPIPIDKQGLDFTLNDVLIAALRGRAHIQKLHPTIPEDKLPGGKVLRRTIDLLNEALNPPPKSDEWTQSSFLDE
jgi:hypothetical protein